MSEHSTGALSTLIQLPLNSLEAANLFSGWVQCWTELAKTQLIEGNRRDEIRARERVALQEIHLRERLLREYMEKSFDERRANFDRLFAMADAALEKGDSADLASVLVAVTELVKTTPFRDIGNLERTQALLREGAEWTI